MIDLIGNTPLIKLKYPSEITGCNIYGKAEFMNPGGSVKDRIGKNMIEDAVNLPNNNYIDSLPSDIVVEVPALINKNGIHGQRLENYPSNFGSLLNNQASTIQLTTEAILNKSKHSVYLALLADPIVDNANLIPSEEKYFLDSLHFTPEGMKLLAKNIAKGLKSYID